MTLMPNAKLYTIPLTATRFAEVIIVNVKPAALKVANKSTSVYPLNQPGDNHHEIALTGSTVGIVRFRHVRHS